MSKQRHKQPRTDSSPIHAGQSFLGVLSILFVIISSTVLVFLVPTAYADSISVVINDRQFDVEYSTAGMTLSNIDIDADLPALLLNVDVTDPVGVLDIVIERALLNYTDKGQDSDFLVTMDGQSLIFLESNTTPQSRTLSIDLPVGADALEIVGTSIYGSHPTVEIADATLTTSSDTTVSDTTDEPPSTTQPDVETLPATEPADETPSTTSPDTETPPVTASVVDTAPELQPNTETPPVTASVVDTAPELQPNTETPPMTDLTNTTTADPVSTPPMSDIQCGAGTLLADGVCVLDEKCGPGTVFEDGMCVLAPSASGSSSLTSRQMGMEWVAGIIGAFVIAGTIGIIMGLISRAGSKSSQN